ncbi:helix-turn-helix domain-containing protein [Flavobacterium sp.]|uniref:helix-turn-helix domain-containing protein n=1 Tax=Flavobacterium sp. TaxID=239 RepID=UPI004047E638
MLTFTTIKEVKDNLGLWCKGLRKSEKLTQKQLAEELALSPLTISKLENGENPTIETLLKVLQYFNEMDAFNQYVKQRMERVNTNESLY